MPRENDWAAPKTCPLSRMFIRFPLKRRRKVGEIWSKNDLAKSFRYSWHCDSRTSGGELSIVMSVNSCRLFVSFR